MKTIENNTTTPEIDTDEKFDRPYGLRIKYDNPDDHKPTEKVNEWVRNKTNNKISKIIDKLDTSTTAIIINAVYFKATWSKQFKTTEKLHFFNDGRHGIKVDTMSVTDDFNYFESRELDSRILELQYLGTKISFIIVLPNYMINGLQRIKSRINSQNLKQAVNSLQSTYMKLFIPKFTAENTYDLKRDIKPLPIALTPVADLSRLTPVPQELCEAIHKTYISVDERGTEAAAVTLLTWVLFSGGNPDPIPVIFRANHPFLYYIMDKSNGLILFSGQINKL
ncbi:unnamed protein product [Medioppia subpectinata]|uniref:Serpin domain-containing protein n=1 Tax=Medioppia subpectinata TaxID=1979941 RepID=A0A7R9KH07_9ACAR|nr:unnamed protein product [Medioppia subpectinata]CAG2103219.1 unnamed protein product [Medioppia subpectinata]